VLLQRAVAPLLEFVPYRTIATKEHCEAAGNAIMPKSWFSVTVRQIHHYHSAIIHIRECGDEIDVVIVNLQDSTAHPPHGAKRLACCISQPKLRPAPVLCRASKTALCSDGNGEAGSASTPLEQPYCTTL